MKKIFYWLLAFVFVVSMAFMGIGCKEAPPVEEVVEEEVPAVEEEVVEEEVVEEEVVEEEVVAEEMYSVVFIDSLLGPWAGGVGKGFADFFADKENFDARIIQAESTSVEEGIAMNETAIAEGVDGILFLVWVSDAFIPAFEMANDAGIKWGSAGTILDIDQFAVPSPDFVVGGQNYPPAYQIAKMAIEEKLNDEGNVVILTGEAGSDVADDRKAGFEDACAEFPGINVLFSDYVAWFGDPCYDTMSDLLVRYDKIDLALTATDPSAQACYEAAAFVGRENEIYFTGWDYYADYKQSMIESEQFYGTVAALPYYMGKVAAYALYLAVSDPQFLQLWIDVEYPVITRENMDVYEAL